MTDPDCEECGGLGYFEYQRRDESFATAVCECNAGADEEPDREDDDCDDTIGGDNK